MQLLGMVLVVHRLTKLNVLIGETQLHLIVHVNVEDNVVLQLLWQHLPVRVAVVGARVKLVILHLLGANVIVIHQMRVIP